MSKRLCSIHGLWNKNSPKDRCPKCKRSDDKNYNKLKRDKASSKLYRSAQWSNIRKLVLSKEPMCRKCTSCLASHVDHIIPIKQGGSLYLFDNLQPLCNSCHTKKTNKEHILNRPYWLPKPKIDVKIICGPSGVGKSYFCESNKTDRTLIVDLDVIRSSVTSKDMYMWDSKEGLDKSLLERNRILCNLGKYRIKEEYDLVLLILQAPKKETREWWAKTLNADVVLIIDSKENCKEKLGVDKRREHKINYFENIVDEWFRNYTSSDIDYIINIEEGVARSLQELNLRTKPITVSLDKPFSGGTL